MKARIIAAVGSPRRSLSRPRPPRAARRGQGRRASPSGCRPTRSTAWPDVVAARQRAFAEGRTRASASTSSTRRGPTHLQKFDATLAGGNAPDVIEMGNTEMTKYMAAGAFQDLTADKASFPNSTPGCRPCRLGQVRRQDLRRSVLRGLARRHLPHRPVQEGRLKVPTTLAAVHGRRAKLAREVRQEGLLAGLHRRQGLVLRDGLRLRLRRQIATQVSGKWKGPLSSPKSIAGLTAFKNFFNVASKAARRPIETHPHPYDVYAQGQAASIDRPGLVQLLRRQDVHAGHGPVRRCRATPRARSCRASSAAPTSPFRSAPTRRSARTGSGTTRARVEKALQAKGNIPNTHLAPQPGEDQREGCGRSWFVPTAKNWVNVENGNVLRTCWPRS